MRVSILFILLSLSTHVAQQIGSHNNKRIARDSDDFIDWFEHHDGDLSSDVGLRESLVRGGFGLFADAALDANQTVLSVPMGLAISPEIARQELNQISNHISITSAGSENHLHVLDGLQPPFLQDLVTSALFLIIARKHDTITGLKRSRYFGYMNWLPESGHMVTMLTDSKLESQLGTPSIALRRIRQIRGIQESLWADLTGAIPWLIWPMNATLSDFRWAIDMIQSRSHSVATKANSHDWTHIKAMMPMADAINMAVLESERNVECYTNQRGTRFLCDTTRQVTAREELLASYGEKLLSNSRLCLEYGFTIPTRLAAPEPFTIDDLLEINEVGSLDSYLSYYQSVGYGTPLSLDEQQLARLEASPLNLTEEREVRSLDLWRIRVKERRQALDLLLRDRDRALSRARAEL